MGKHARRALASQPLIFANPTATTNTDAVFGYQCTCYRKRCRCGASGVRILDANTTSSSLGMVAQQRLVGMSQPYGYPAGYGYGCGGGHRARRARRQGPITALVGGLINL